MDGMVKRKDVAHGSDTLRLFGFSIIQHNDFICTTDEDEKLFAREPVSLTRLRKNVTDGFNQIEMVGLSFSTVHSASWKNLFCHFAFRLLVDFSSVLQKNWYQISWGKKP